MNNKRDPDPALARWYFLPSLDAHCSRLPAGLAARVPRAVRLASAGLMRAAARVPSRAQIGWLQSAGFQPEPHAWRLLSLQAGGRYFSSALRRTTGSALSSQLAAEMGAERWRACLAWVDPGLDAVVSVGGPGAGDVVACAGAELLLAHMEGAGEAFKARLRLRSAQADIQYCSTLYPPADGAACRRIADAVLGQGTE